MRPLPLLVALTLTSLSCSDDGPRPDTGPHGGDVEEGDWRDTGPFAGCAVDTAATACGSLGAFDTTGCTPGGLATLELEGVYTVHVRGRNPRYGNNYGFASQALRLDASGEQYAGGLALDTRQVAAGGNVFLSSSRTEPSTGGTRRRSYLGCQSPEPDRLQGCYVECVDGALEVEGTFEARKVTPRPGEGEASGLERISETAVPDGLPVDVYVTHGHAYVVALGGGLYVYDLADPARPVLTEHVLRTNDNSWNGVWAHRDALYVASAARGVIVFDLADPGHPVEVFATGRQRTNVHTVFVDGHLLFAASPSPTGEVLVYDLSDPFAPQLTGTFQASGFDVSTSYGPHDMFAFEGRLYVNFWRAGYVIASLERPDAPRQLGSYRYEHSTSHASAVGRFGERVIAFEGGEDWGAHLRVLDVTDPTSVRRIGEHRLREHLSLHNMVLVGTRLYVAWYHEGVRVLDVSTPETPREVAYYNTFRPGDPGRGSSFYDGAIGMRVPGDGFIYVVDTSRGLLVLREP
ncbi:hypothetical protein LZ198_32470 [Myxococcus sp. K15C18031901]|uniref:LVIVD repeat-containing protein n=1 Tax=Myxococcus dinghuensis TaxID=2906761 RepID=UPI0020A7263A|nr:hypothetical protein [Myxococcus dinghuensis]MCP3103609.1 hypothetical protein [Myxococcus dinghuensis]